NASWSSARVRGASSSAPAPKARSSPSISAQRNILTDSYSNGRAAHHSPHERVSIEAPAVPSGTASGRNGTAHRLSHSPDRWRGNGEIRIPGSSLKGAGIRGGSRLGANRPTPGGKRPAALHLGGRPRP